MADTLQHDLRAAWRSLRRSPRFTFLALAMLVVGIGATTAIFSLVRGVLLRPLPYDDPGRLVVVWADLVKQGNHRFSVTPDDFADIRKDTVHFSAVAAQLGWGANFTGDGPPEAIRGAQVSSQFFAVAGIVPRLGRAITAEDSAETGGQVVVLADGLWRRRFGGDPSVIGRAIRIDDRPYTVIGVMPREFRAPSFFKAPSLQAEFWVPLALPAAWNNREAAVLQILARLAPGVTGAEARNAMSALATRLQAAYPATNTDVGFNVVPLHEQLVGSTRTVLLVLLGGVGLLLLIACANVASLLLARGIARRRDVAVRVALGAGRQRLVRTFLAESLLLAGTGGLLGLGLAAGGLHALVSLLPADMPRLDQIRLDPAVFGFTFGVSALVGVIFGVVPAIRATRLNPAGALVAGGARGVVRSTGGIRAGLVIGQVALATLLLVGAGLMTRTMHALLQIDPGFRADHVLTFRMVLPSVKYAGAAERLDFFREFMERLEADPGIIAAGGTTRFPLDPSYGWGALTVRGEPAAEGQEPLVGVRTITIDYFHALDIPLKGGRGFTARDDRSAPAVVIVNTTLADRFFPGGALGRQIAFGPESQAGTSDSPWLTIIGVAGSVSHDGLEAAPIPEAYLPFRQDPVDGLDVVVRTSAPPETLAGPVRAILAGIDPELPLIDLRTMDDIVGAAVARPRASMLLLGGFAGLAILLAGIGMYGLLAYGVALRKREIGLRLALGAQPGDVLALVTSQGLRLAVTGLGLGLLGAVALSGLISSQVYGIRATDPLTLAVAAVLALTATLLASWFPARRATRISPMEALKAE